MLTRCLTVSLLLIVILTALSDAAEFATMPNRRKAKPKVEPPKVEEKVEIEEPPPLPPPEPVIIESVLPEPIIEQNLDPYVKIVIHSAPWCKVCPAAIAEAEKLKDGYEVVVEEHENGFQTSYGYYINSFPYIEYYYDGKVKLYNYGYRTEAQLRRTIEQLK